MQPNNGISLLELPVFSHDLAQTSPRLARPSGRCVLGEDCVRFSMQNCRFCLHFISATNPVRFQRNQPLTLDPGFTKSGFVSPPTRQYGLILSINPCDRPRLTSDRTFSSCLQEKTITNTNLEFDSPALSYFNSIKFKMASDGRSDKPISSPAMVSPT